MKFRNITSEVFGDFTPDTSHDEENKGFVRALDEVIHSYIEDPASESYDRILCHVVEGIANDSKLPTLIDVDVDEHHVGPLFIEYEDGSESLALTTEEDEIPAMGMKIRTLIHECEQNEKCDGFIFNYGKENSFFLPLRLLQTAIRAGYQIAIDEIEEDEESMTKERDK